MQRLAVAIAFCSACGPGKSTIVNPGADASSSDAAVTSDGAPNSGTPDMGPTSDLGGAPDLSGPDFGPPDPDMGATPSRVWTAEADGTIAWWTFDPANSSLTPAGSIERGGNQNFLALSADRTRLYAANGRRVEAFDITTVPPQFLGDADAGVADVATHLAVDATNSHVFVAWYGGDAVSVLPLGVDGSPSDATTVFGGGADPSFCRRAHQVRIHPSNRFVYVPCLASDHVVGFAYDAASGDVTRIGAFDTAAGMGPRHMDFHPTLDQAYVIGEQDDSIARFGVDTTTGTLTLLGSVSTLPNPGDTIGPASDVHVSPDGRWVVGINRNPRDEIVTYAVAADGSLSNPTWVATGGQHARTFTFTPRGEHLLVGNSNSQDLGIFTFVNGAAVQTELVGGFDARLFFVGVE